MNRIKFLREEKGLYQKDLAKLLNLSVPAINYYENEKRAMDTKTALILADYFEVSVDYLLGKTDVRKPIENINNPKKYYMCPVYGRISAGQPNWAEECLEGFLPIDPTLMNIVNPKECFFLRVNGESMNKEIQNGAYALIRKTDSVDDGDIAVVLVNGYDATLKVFNRQGDFILLEPMSTDSSFKTQVYGKDIEIKIIGKYIGKMEMK